MKRVDTIFKELNLKDTNTSGVDLIPTRQVELIFDPPEGVDPQNASVWQSYFDGSVLKLSSKIDKDGKIRVLTYKLGNFIVAYDSDKASATDKQDTQVQNKDTAPVVWIVLGAVLVVIVIGAVLFVGFKKRRARNGK